MAMALPELHAARFVSEERHQNGYLAFSLKGLCLLKTWSTRINW